MRILIYEPDVTGHRSEYVQHLVEYACQRINSLSVELFYLLHPDFSRSFPAIANLLEKSRHQTLIELSRKAYEERERAEGLRRRSAQEWSIFSRYAEEVSADHCIALNLNILQYALGWPSAQNLPFDLSGILFHPYTRLEAKGTGVQAKTFAGLRRVKKYIQLKWAVRNCNVKRIHVLNDQQAVDDLNATAGLRPIFSMLPDPVIDGKNDVKTGFDVRAKYGIDAERKLFLLFGSLRRSKGVLQAVEAFKQLEKHVQSKAALLLLGRVKEDVKPLLYRLVEEAQRGGSTLRIVLDDRFVSGEEMIQAFEQCDIVLLPYQRTEGSTGVLGHAARAGKPVIGSETGLIGDLIRASDLGLTTACDKTSRISEAITRAVQCGISTDTKKQSEYVQHRSPKAFSKTLIPSACQ